MMPYKMVFENIQPKLLNQLKGVRACFTYKNPHWRVEGQSLPGLNLGFNTGEDETVVREHRRRLLEELQIESRNIAFADQVHGSRVQVVTGGGTYGDTDALVTQIPGLALAIQVADCAAVLLADNENRIIGAVHAGWRGAAGGILSSAIERMLGLGALPDNIHAFISPCISMKHFEVGPEVAEQFPDRFVDYDSYRKPHVDLKGFLSYQLQQHGIRNNNIEVHQGCTVADENRFYSYRREKEQSGRMLGIIWLEG